MCQILAEVARFEDLPPLRGPPTPASSTMPPSAPQPHELGAWSISSAAPPSREIFARDGG